MVYKLKNKRRRQWSPKQLINNQNHDSDVFSWSKFSQLLDAKLEKLGTKEDFFMLTREIEILKEENARLRFLLSSRVEHLDRKSRIKMLLLEDFQV